MVDQQRVLTEPNTYWKKENGKRIERKREKFCTAQQNMMVIIMYNYNTAVAREFCGILFKQKAAPNEINIIVVYFVSCPRALAVAAFKKRHSPQRKNATLYIDMGLEQKPSGRKAIACHYSFDGNQKRVFIDFAMILLLRQCRS